MTATGCRQEFGERQAGTLAPSAAGYGCGPSMKAYIIRHSAFCIEADFRAHCLAAGPGQDADQARNAGAGLAMEVYQGCDLLAAQEELSVSSLVDVSAPGAAAVAPVPSCKMYRDCNWGRGLRDLPIRALYYAGGTRNTHSTDILRRRLKPCASLGCSTHCRRTVPPSMSTNKFISELCRFMGGGEAGLGWPHQRVGGRRRRNTRRGEAALPAATALDAPHRPSQVRPDPTSPNRSVLACAVLERLSCFFSADRVQLQEAEGSSRFWWLRFWAMGNASEHRRVQS